MENSQLFKAILFFGVGLFLILQSIFDWEFFYNKYKYKFEVRLLGKKGLRVLRLITGLIIIIMTYYSIFVVEAT